MEGSQSFFRETEFTSSMSCREKIREGLDDCSTTRNEPPVKIDKTQEFTKFSKGSWRRKIVDSVNFVWKWSYAVGIDAMPKEIQIGGIKQALGWFDDNTVFIKSSEENVQMLQIF